MRGERSEFSRETQLVGLFVDLAFPGAEGFERFVAHDLRGWDFALRVRLLNLLVDERIVEAGLRGVGRGAAKIKARGTRPVDGAEAHGAGLTRSVELALAKLKEAERGAGLAYRDDLGVSCGVVSGRDAIGAFGDDFTVLHDDGAEGTAAIGAHTFDGELDGSRHEGAGHFLSISGIARHL